MPRPAYTHAVTLADGTDQSTYTTPSYSFTAGRLYIISVLNTRSGGSPSTISSIAHPESPGLVSWTMNASVPFSELASPLRRVTTGYGYLPGSSGTSTTQINFGGVTQTGCVVSIEEVTLFDGTYVDTVQTNAVDNVAGGVPFVVTKALPGIPIESMFAAFAYDANSTTHPTYPGGWTELFSDGVGSPIAHLCTGWGTASHPQAQLAGARDWAGIANTVMGVGAAGSTYNETVTLAATAALAPSALGTFPRSAALAADAALAPGSAAVLGGALTFDADTAVALASSHALVAALALEADTALALADELVPPGGGTTYAESVALDADTALALADELIPPAGTIYAESLALDADTTLDLVAGSSLAGDLTLEADTALAHELALLMAESLTLTVEAQAWFSRTADIRLATGLSARQGYEIALGAAQGVGAQLTAVPGMDLILTSEAEAR